MTDAVRFAHPAGLLRPLTGSLLVFAFLFAVMLSGKVAGMLALLGVILWLVGLPASAAPDHRDRTYIVLMFILPTIYAFSMIGTGWVVHELDRPMHLVWSIPIYLLLRRTGLHLRAFTLGLLAFSLAGLIIGIHEVYSLHMGRPQAAFSNAGPYGNYSAVFALCSVVFLLIRWQSPQARWLKGCAAVTAIACLVCAVISATRSAWLAVPILFLIGVVAIFGRRIWQHKHGLALGLVVGVALCGVLLATPIVHERIATGAEELTAYFAAPDDPAARNTSIGVRLLSWEWGWHRFLAHPVFGVGFANFRADVAAAVAAGTLPEVMLQFKGLHNLIIDHLAKTGIVGTAGLIAFWAGLLTAFGRAVADAPAVHRYFAICGLLLVSGEIIFSAIGSMFASSLGTLLFVFVMAICAAGAHPDTAVFE